MLHQERGDTGRKPAWVISVLWVLSFLFATRVGSGPYAKNPCEVLVAYEFASHVANRAFVGPLELVISCRDPCVCL